MTAAVRYYSRSGNTKAMAEAIAKAAGVQAVSVDTADAAIREPVDVLFIGGALYAYGIDSHLKDYIGTMDPGCAKKAVVFSTSWFSKHSIDLIKNALREKKIPVEDEALYFRGKPGAEQLKAAEVFAEKYL